MHAMSNKRPVLMHLEVGVGGWGWVGWEGVVHGVELMSVKVKRF